MSGYYPPQGPPQQQQPFGYPQQAPPGGQGYGQQPFGAPYGGPPPSQYQQQQQFMPPHGPPGQQPMMPPQQGYNYGQPPMQQPPMQQPPMQQGYQHPPGPPPQGFQQQMPPQAQQQYVQPSMASPGYNREVAQGNAGPDVDALGKAMSGFKKDHSTVIRILARQSPAEMALLRQTYAQRNGGASLESKVDSYSRGNYGDVLLQLTRGPLMADVYNVNRAIKGLGTKEDMLNDVLIGRSNADMQAIKAGYQEVFHKNMESDVGDDLSLKTKTMFQLIMRASRTEESAPYNPVQINQDTDAIHHATGALTTVQETVFTILTQRSDNQIRAIAVEYQKKYKETLERSIESKFSGHMKDALLLCVGRAVDRAKTDAYGLEGTMKGLGTKDNQLINMVVRIHWDRQNKDQVKKAYLHFFKKDLIGRVRGETSGDYRDALVACLS